MGGQETLCLYISPGIGSWLDKHELYAMASYPVLKNMIQVEDFTALPTVTNMIKDAVCDSELHWLYRLIHCTQSMHTHVGKHNN